MYLIKNKDIISKGISYTKKIIRSKITQSKIVKSHKKNNVIHNGSEIEREKFENKTIE